MEMKDMVTIHQLIIYMMKTTWMLVSLILSGTQLKTTVKEIVAQIFILWEFHPRGQSVFAILGFPGINHREIANSIALKWLIHQIRARKRVQTPALAQINFYGTKSRAGAFGTAQESLIPQDFLSKGLVMEEVMGLLKMS